MIYVLPGLISHHVHDHKRRIVQISFPGILHVLCSLADGSEDLADLGNAETIPRLTYHERRLNAIHLLTLYVHYEKSSLGGTRAHVVISSFFHVLGVTGVYADVGVNGELVVGLVGVQNVGAPAGEYGVYGSGTCSPNVGCLDIS
jgi:hypothetical protein